MRSFLIMFVQSSLGRPAGLSQILEHLNVQEFVAQATEKGFRKTVFPRARWLNVKHLQARRLAVRLNCLGNKLGSVVAANVLGHASREKQVRQNIKYRIGRDATINLQGQTLSRIFIRDGKPFERSTICRSIMNEVPRPNMVFVLRATTYATIVAMAQTSLFVGLLRHFKALFTPQTVDPLETNSPTVLPKFCRDHAITVSRVFTYKLVDSCYQSLFFFADRFCFVAL